MTKEDYTRYKNNGQLDDIAFYYYKEMKKPEDKDLDVEEFKLLLKQFITKYSGHFMQTSSGLKSIHASQIKNKLIAYYDEKFK